MKDRKEKPKGEKRGKNFEIQDPYLEVVFGYFNEVTDPKLTFSQSNRHDCPVQPIESSADIPKLVIISHQS